MQYCNQIMSGGNTFNGGHGGQSVAGYHPNQQFPRFPPPQNFAQGHGQQVPYGAYGYHGHGQSHSVYQYNYQAAHASSQGPRYGQGSFLHERLMGQQHQEGYYYGQQNGAGGYPTGMHHGGGVGGQYPGYHGNVRPQTNYPMHAQPKAIAHAPDGMGYVAEDEWYTHDDSKQKAYERFTQNNSRIQSIMDETAVNCAPPVVTMERVAVLKEQVGLLQDELTKQSVEVKMERTKCRAGMKQFLDSTTEFNIKYQKLCEPIGQETFDEMADRFYQKLKQNRGSKPIITEPPEDDDEVVEINRVQPSIVAPVNDSGQEQYTPNGQMGEGHGEQQDISYSRGPTQYPGNHGYEGAYAHQNYYHPQSYAQQNQYRMGNQRMPQAQGGNMQQYMNGGVQHHQYQQQVAPVYAHPSNHGDAARYTPYQKSGRQQELTPEERLERAKKSNMILTAYKKFLESRQNWEAQQRSGGQMAVAPPPPPLQQMQPQQQMQYTPTSQPPPLEYVGRRGPRGGEQKSTRVTRSAARALKNGGSGSQNMPMVDPNYGMFPHGYAPPQRIAPILFNGGGLVEVNDAAKPPPQATVTSAVAMYGSLYGANALVDDDPLADVVSANENMDRRAAEEKLLKDVWMTPEISVKDATSTSGGDKDGTVAANPILANILEAPLLNASGQRDALSDVLCAGIGKNGNELEAVDLGEDGLDGELDIPNFDTDEDSGGDDMFGRLELSQ